MFSYGMARCRSIRAAVGERIAMRMDLDSSTDQVLGRCEELSRCSEAADCLTRTFLKPPMRQVHECLSRWMLEAGLQVRLDALGNLIGRQAAASDPSQVFIVGSHVDTVPHAGKYDGVLGVLLGVAAAQAFAGVALRHHLDVVAFSEEEGVRFRTPYLGSRALCGDFDSTLLKLTDTHGITLAQAILDFGLDPSAVPTAAYPPGAMAGYFEAHIEQGPILESMDLALGVVEGIVGQSRRCVTFLGHAGHAGTAPMPGRRDALAGAAEFVTSIECLAQAMPGLRATVGRLEVKPGAVNVIPGEVNLTLDLRHAEDATREASLADVLALSHSIAAQRRLTFIADVMADQPAAPCDKMLTQKLERALTAAGHPLHRMVSGAGHDAAVMSRHCPAAMLFLRSPGGISHHPDESVRPEDVRAALDVMIRFLRHELVKGSMEDKRADLDP